MKVIVRDHYDELSKLTAGIVADYIRTNPESLICLPSGESPTGTLKYLVEYAKEGRVNLAHCYFIGLDEWVGVDGSIEGSTQYYLNKHFFEPLQIPHDRIVFFDGRAADLDKECQRINAFVAKHGPIDVMLVGIGTNGHIGLNEPGVDVNQYAHHMPLAESTKAAAQRYFQQGVTLTEGITLGLRHFSEARLGILIASGDKKSEIILKSLTSEVSNEVPATILQEHPNALVILDEAAAQALRRDEHSMSLN